MAGKDAIPTKTKEEFNKYRKLLLVNLPPSTEGEIQEFLGSFSASKINISDSLDSAVVTLSDGDQLDEAVTKLNNKQFKDNIVRAKPGVSSHLLCVAHIPPTYTDFKFREFCKKYGPVEYCYVMRTASGLSKGYGLVEFSTDAEQVEHIKSEIDWQSLDGHILHADFVASSYQTWEGLQSRCLFLHNMPENFVDVSKLREIFGCISNPVYCQIIIKEEKSLGFGIIEFRTAEDAEKTWLKLKNEKIAGKDVNNKEEKDDLSQEPVAMPVIAGNAIAISLTKQMPRLMGDFMLVLHELQEAYVSQMMSPENKPGLLGAAPSLPLSPKMNPNMQLGLMVMLAIHIQTVKSGQVSQKPGQKIPLLSDSLMGQANVILLNLKQQLNQVPVLGDNGKPLAEPVSLDDKVRFIVKKFIANGRYLNLTLLSALGQILVNMKQLDTPSYGLGPRTPSILGPLPGPASQLLINAQLGKPAPAQLGNTSSVMTPQPTQNVNNIEAKLNSTINSTIMQAMGLNVGSGSSLGNVGTNLLNQISQGLMTQIGQNLLQQLTGSGKGQASNKKSKGSSAAQSSLAGALAQNVSQAKGPMAAGVFNQNVWKNEDTSYGTYGAKVEAGTTGMAAGYGNYGYGANEYGYAAGYGAGGTAANTGGYGMNTGYENNQASGGGNYQVGGGMGTGQFGAGGMAGSGMGSGGMGSGMGSGGMGTGQFGAGGMAGSGMGSGGMGTGQFGAGGMAGSGLGTGEVGSGQYGVGGMGSGNMGVAGMGGGNMGASGMGNKGLGGGLGEEHQWGSYGQMSDQAADNSGYPNEYSEGQGYMDAYKRNRLY
ncbi:unnamed protein product [Candidula unifasciata]|uniref:RRM domain-containing protein n=1 Tax=Candidula unifasciata TaxID=100452 RepID=A0A8S3YQH5_9EUPU|nr:unnamed protein product [Candidula unifasciata]